MHRQEGAQHVGKANVFDFCMISPNTSFNLPLVRVLFFEANPQRREVFVKACTEAFFLSSKIRKNNTALCDFSQRAVKRWLPGQDSNLRPIGYECPNISIGLGLSHHPPGCRFGCRALMRHYWTGSSTSSLCTFLPTHGPSAGFAQDYHVAALSRVQRRLP